MEMTYLKQWTAWALWTSLTALKLLPAEAYSYLQVCVLRECSHEKLPGVFFPRHNHMRLPHFIGRSHFLLQKAVFYSRNLPYFQEPSQGIRFLCSRCFSGPCKKIRFKYTAVLLQSGNCHWDKWCMEDAAFHTKSTKISISCFFQHIKSIQFKLKRIAQSKIYYDFMCWHYLTYKKLFV